jgi:hypothetical protein
LIAAARRRSTEAIIGSIRASQAFGQRKTGDQRRRMMFGIVAQAALCAKDVHKPQHDFLSNWRKLSRWAMSCWSLSRGFLKNEERLALFTKLVQIIRREVFHGHIMQLGFHLAHPR